MSYKNPGVRTFGNRILPVKPKTKLFFHSAFQRKHTGDYGKYFWRRITDPEYTQASIWTSDFKHRYLINTGRDYTGPIPQSPAAGMYQGLEQNSLTAGRLGNFQKPARETRALPVLALTPRVVYEWRREVKQDYFSQVKADKRAISEMKESEFHEWYMKLQRVRGKWCRENAIRSRGIYGPAVDAAEIWG